MVKVHHLRAKEQDGADRCDWVGKIHVLLSWQQFNLAVGPVCTADLTITTVVSLAINC